MAKQKKDMSEEELARYYQQRRDDESLWSETPASVTIRKEGGTLFSLRLPAEELEMLRQEAERQGTSVSALFRDGARLLVETKKQGALTNDEPTDVESEKDQLRRLSEEISDLIIAGKFDEAGKAQREAARLFARTNPEVSELLARIGSGVAYSLPPHLYERVLASRPLIETIMEERQDIQDCLNLLVELGLERLLTDMIGNAEKDLLLKAILQYAARAPEVVYGHTVEMLTLGAEINAESQPGETTRTEGDSNVIEFRRKTQEKVEALRSHTTASS